MKILAILISALLLTIVGCQIVQIGTEKASVDCKMISINDKCVVIDKAKEDNNHGTIRR